MVKFTHIGIYIDNKSDKRSLLKLLESNSFSGLDLNLQRDKTVVFSKFSIEKMIDEEVRHDKFLISAHEGTPFQLMSSGQQRNALLSYQLSLSPECIILDDLYGNIDLITQQHITEMLKGLSDSILMIQVFSRKKDLLPFINKVVFPNEQQTGAKLELNRTDFLKMEISNPNTQAFSLPESYELSSDLSDILVDIKNVSVNYGEKAVLRNIDWTIKKGEFWQLAGANGSGKSTLVTMITGDNPKAYGQDIWLFGRKKGSGESIWDIKKQIGYFTPSMTQHFTRDDSVENMIISGLNDSVGLYVQPSDIQRNIAQQWLEMLGSEFKTKSFQRLSVGQQRMVMTARAMVKHPPLLILDEPTIDLDDQNSKLFIEMVNAIASEKKMAVIYISHREEENLKPEKVFELKPIFEGFTGSIKSKT